MKNVSRREVSPSRRVRGFATVVLSALLAACGTLPSNADRPFSAAHDASDASPLVQVARVSSPGASLTGFRLLPLGSYALDARIQLIKRARDSLDVQYYLIENDSSGRLLMRNLRDAALRGVRVRLLVDDLFTAGNDAMFRDLATFPNVEVRLFNPFCCARRSTAGKYLASIADLGRLNHRMHNKLLVADRSMVVMGGRNIADDYFTRSSTDNFIDMDVFIVGAVVERLVGIFDLYWNSPQAYPVEAVIAGPPDRRQAQRDFDHLVGDGNQMMSVDLPSVDILGYGPLRDDLDFGRLGLVWGTAVAFADQPAKVMATSAEMARSMSAQMNIMDRVEAAKDEVVISSPYFVPGPVGAQRFVDLRKRDVKVAVLTNSLAATDVPAVHAGYARYRLELLRAGVELFELSPTRIVKNERLSLPGASLGRLHAKTAVIDRSTVYIGSVNLDPRSESTNTELGIVAESPELAKEVLRVITISKLKSSYRLRLTPDRQRLQWLVTEEHGDAVFSEEPEVTLLTRLKNRLFAPFVPEQLL